ncbi:MAG: hypothetical protein K6F59_02370 [Gammaproteobacteria bacterium]|nr:hypothetical protein [Gammaproteobacteria bacterium]
MKKSLIIVLLVVAVVSVFALGILIPKIEQTIVTVKVTGVEFTNADITIKKDKDNNPLKDDNGNDFKIINLEEGVTSYQIEWKVYPYDEENKKSGATTPDVTFQVMGSNKVTITSDGLLTLPAELTKSLSVTVKVTTTDGNKSDYVEIFIKHENIHVIDD